MRTRTHQVKVSGLVVEVVRKRIKNLYLRVEPPHGRVRIAAPLAATDEAIRQAVNGRLGWIQRHQARIAAQPRPARNQFVSGEIHAFLGLPFQLHVIERDSPRVILMRDGLSLKMHVRPDSTREQRQTLLRRWYREQLEAMIPVLVDRWQPVLGVRVSEWRIKRMRTKWGTCNISARRIWLNMELAKRPAGCLEYVVVHEMVHLLERYHNSRFKALMDTFLPLWRLRKQELNSIPISG